jgi:hypothetical protein
MKNADLTQLRTKYKKVWKGCGDARAARDSRKITTPRSKINGDIVRYFSEPLSVFALPIVKQFVAAKLMCVIARRNLSVWLITDSCFQYE